MKSGAVNIVNDCLKFLSKNLYDQYEIIALVYNKNLYLDVDNILFIEYPQARKSVFLRLYYEYFQFLKVSKKYKPLLWLSMQDSTPRVQASVRAVYIHNPAIGYNFSIKYLFKQFRYAAYFFLAKKIYPLFINKNDFIITQQQSLSQSISRRFNIGFEKMIISPPVSTKRLDNYNSNINRDSISKKYQFIYPATAFIYKNHDTIIKAASHLKLSGVDGFDIIFTLTGNENGYATKLKKKAAQLPIQFIGFVSQDELYSLYNSSDCLIFPSLNESWGLPLSEFTQFNKPIIAADLPYANETIGNYDKTAFFEPTNYKLLASYMEQAINNALSFRPVKSPSKTCCVRYAQSWRELFDILLNRQCNRAL